MTSRIITLALAVATGSSAMAESLVVARLIRPGELLTAQDLVATETHYPGTITARADAEGFEARVTLFPGRPVSPGDLGPPRLVRRNELVTLVYRRSAIEIRAEGRALSDGAEGDVIQVMNLDSRTRLSGVVSLRGNVIVSGRN